MECIAWKLQVLGLGDRSQINAQSRHIAEKRVHKAIEPSKETYQPNLPFLFFGSLSCVTICAGTHWKGSGLGLLSMQGIFYDYEGDLVFYNGLVNRRGQ